MQTCESERDLIVFDCIGIELCTYATCMLILNFVLLSHVLLSRGGSPCYQSLIVTKKKSQTLKRII